MTKDVILKPSGGKENTLCTSVLAVPAPGPRCPGPAEPRPVGRRHSPWVFPVHSHQALHPFAEFLHLYDLFLLHVLQELGKLRREDQ